MDKATLCNTTSNGPFPDKQMEVNEGCGTEKISDMI
jgi:hypothetical protein